MSDASIYSLSTTADGTHTVLNQALNQTYHSRHGAVQESMHVFITHGLLPKLVGGKSISVFEMGFGTGLNAWLTAKHALPMKTAVYYESIEAFPLDEDIWRQLNYAEQTSKEENLLFNSLHMAAWEEVIQLNEFFTLKKINTQLQNYSSAGLFDIIYYDAFSPTAQPDLWTVEVFKKIYTMMKPGAWLTTYCSKGYVRRNMQAAGLTVEKLQGPPGKREMVRAAKL